MTGTQTINDNRKAECLTRWASGDEIRWAAREWATRLGVRLSGIFLTKMTRKWASISTGGKRLTLNTELLDLPKELGEYVIVHELVHLLAPNHGKLFKAYLNAYLPDWEKRENRLTKTTNGATHRTE